MIVKNIDELNGSEREVIADNWISRRLLLASDGLGFSFHQTMVKQDTETRMHYKHHVEAVYCIGGEGEIELIGSGTIFQIGPGVMYALDQHEPHILRARQDMLLICVFSPPLHGREVHGEDGSYPKEQKPTLLRIF